MKTIDELLDEYKTAAIDFGFPDFDSSEIIVARAAVDAKIKEMQDRIAELERQNFLLEEDNMKYDMALIRKLTSETTPVSEIK